MFEKGRVSISLTASPTLQEAAYSDAFFRIIHGPVGSGKSTYNCGEIMRRAMEQPVSPDGYRHTKWAIVRNTTPELKSTTIKTWQSVFPENRCGPIKWSSPINHHIVIPSSGPTNEMDNPDFMPGIDCFVEFLGMDRPKDVKKLLSWEGTGIWGNEMRELERSVVEAFTMRVGRYPSQAQTGVDCGWYGVLGDTNPSDEDHWLYELEMDAPAGYEFFHQPPAVIRREEATFEYTKDDVIEAAGIEWLVNPYAENLRNLPSGYYHRILPGKRLDWIRVYLEGKYGYVQDGKPVIPEYNDQIMSVASLPFLKDRPLLWAADIGGGTLQPAGILFQRHPRGMWLIHEEIICTDMGLDSFSRQVKHAVADLFPNVKISTGYGDPAGATKDEIFEVMAFDHLRQQGLPIFPAPSNKPKMRVEAIRTPMGRMIDGKPGILIHKRCKVLRKGLSGAWQYRRLQVAGREVFADIPDKGDFSHVCDALGYGLLGGGEHRQITRGAQQHVQTTTLADVDFNP